jgi:hypothetical protein
MRFGLFFLLTGALVLLQGRALADERGKIFDMQVSKFGTLDGGTNVLNLGDGRASIIPTAFALKGSVTVTPALFRGWVEKYHPLFARISNNLSTKSVVEVKGAYDKADRPLTAMGIPHESISPHQVMDFDLTDTKVMIVDCPGKLSRNACQKIRDFVSGGGSLLTTDWALDYFLERAIPGYVKWDGWQSRSEVVDAEMVSLPSSMAGGIVSNAGWRLDESSHGISVSRPQGVQILAVSRILARREPTGQGILALEFSFGRGKVLHMIGHFDNHPFFLGWNSLPDPASVIGISLRQALAANFVISALQPKSEQTQN